MQSEFVETHCTALLLSSQRLQPTDTHVKPSDTHDLEATVTQTGREELGNQSMPFTHPSISQLQQGAGSKRTCPSLLILISFLK